MKLNVNYCPSCGNPLDIKGYESSVVCPMCGNRVTITYENDGAADRRTRFTDAGTGLPIGTALVPHGWQGGCHVDNVRQSNARPFRAQIDAFDSAGDVLFANTGEAFIQSKTGGLFGGHREGQPDPYTNTPMRAFVLPHVYLDQMIQALVPNTPITCTGTYALAAPSMKDIEATRAGVRRDAETMAAGMPAAGYSIRIQNVFAGGVVRAYRYQQNGANRTFLLGADIRGLEYSMHAGGLGGMGGGLGGVLAGAALGGVGGALIGGIAAMGSGALDYANRPQKNTGSKTLDFFLNGGLVGQMQRKKKAEREAARQTANARASANVTGTGASANAQSSAGASGTPFGQAQVAGAAAAYVSWESVAVYGLSSPDPFSESMLNLFNAFTESVVFDPAVKSRMEAMAQQETNRNMQRQQQEFQTWQNINRQQQAAFDRANQAWWDRTNAADAAARARSAEQYARSSPADKWDEAIRGVNTYTRPDGSEVQYDVGADRVFMKDGDPSTVRGANAWEDVPSGWTELHKKD